MLKVTVLFGVRKTNAPGGSIPKDRVLTMHYKAADGAYGCMGACSREEITLFEGFLSWCKRYALFLKDFKSPVEFEFHNLGGCSLDEVISVERVFREVTGASA